MSPKKPARIEKDRKLRREQILTAATRVFFKKGILNTTMDDIAQELEVAKGFLYYYFSSRDDLLLALIKEGWQAFYSIVSAKDIPGGRDGFFILLRRLIDAYNAQPDLYGVLFQLSPQASALFSPVRLRTAERYKKRAYDLIRTRLEVDLKVADSSQLMRDIGGIFFGHLRLGRERKPISADEVLGTIKKFLPPSEEELHSIH